MTNEQLERNAQGNTSETFSPVIVTEGVGTVFLGLITIILMVVVGGLLVRNRKLEDQLMEIMHSSDL